MSNGVLRGRRECEGQVSKRAGLPSTILQASLALLVFLLMSLSANFGMKLVAWNSRQSNTFVMKPNTFSSYRKLLVYYSKQENAELRCFALVRQKRLEFVYNAQLVEL